MRPGGVVRRLGKEQPIGRLGRAAEGPVAVQPRRQLRQRRGRAGRRRLQRLQRCL